MLRARRSTWFFSEALWAELRPHGVDVLSYIIGRTDTPAHRELMAERGMAVPDNLAHPDDVARKGLARLGNGPVTNWDWEDDDPGASGIPANEHRESIPVPRASAALRCQRGEMMMVNTPDKLADKQAIRDLIYDL